MKKRVILYAGIALLVLIVLASIPFIYSALHQREYRSNLSVCDDRENLPGRFQDLSIKILDKNGDLVANKRVDIVQIEPDFIFQTHEDTKVANQFRTSLSMECVEYTMSSYDERGALSEAELEELCDFEWIADNSKAHPLSTVRVEPARLTSRTLSVHGANQDHIQGIEKETVFFDEFEKQDLTSQEMYFRLLKEHDAQPYLIQVCGEWNARPFDTMKGLGRKELAEYCDKVVRIVRKYYPDTLVAVELLPFYEYRERGLCKPHCDSIPTFFYDGTLQITDEEFLDDLEQLGTPYDVISAEYQMGQEHFGDAEDLIFLTERFKKYNKKFFDWDLTLLSRKIDIHWEEGAEQYDWPEAEGNFSEEWQREQYAKYFDYVLSNKDNLGMTVFVITDPRTEMARPEALVDTYSGFLRQDGTEKPSYAELERLHSSLRTNCYVYTDENGVARFKANPGTYKIYADGREVAAHIG